MSRKGWPRESGRHSLAARGLKTNKRTPKYRPAVATNQADQLKERPKPEEALQTVCAELEQTAAKEAGDEEAASGLLADADWFEAHIDEVLASFEIDDGIRTSLVARVRKKYVADGEAE